MRIALIHWKEKETNRERESYHGPRQASGHQFTKTKNKNTNLTTGFRWTNVLLEEIKDEIKKVCSHRISQEALSISVTDSFIPNQHNTAQHSYSTDVDTFRLQLFI